MGVVGGTGSGGPRGWALVGDHHCSFPLPTSWHRRERAKGGGRGCILSFVIPVVIPLVRSKFSWKAWAEGKGCLQRAATALTADRNRTVHNLAMI